MSLSVLQLVRAFRLHIKLGGLYTWIHTQDTGEQYSRLHTKAQLALLKAPQLVGF